MKCGEYLAQSRYCISNPITSEFGVLRVETTPTASKMKRENITKPKIIDAKVYKALSPRTIIMIIFLSVPTRVTFENKRATTAPTR